MLPKNHQRFMDRALPVLQRDKRILGIAGAGSWITGTMDQYSDIDLIVVVEPKHYPAVMLERHSIVKALGGLLAAFTGEHVGEPRLLICLYDDPLLHVDVKFVSLEDLEIRIENPVVIWERAGEISKAIAQSEPCHPMPDLQWIEDRFWVWIHYAALRLGRGELLEVVDFLSYLRSHVLGPLALVASDQLPRGVRRIETLAPSDLPDLVKTIPSYDRQSCAAAINASISLYLRLRNEAASTNLVPNPAAERAAREYLKTVNANG